MRRNAVLFVLISMLSGFGSTAMMLAAGIWVFDLTGHAGIAALAGLCVYAPSLAAPWLGALVDRLPRRPLLIAVDLLLGPVLLSLLAVRSAAMVWLIFAVLLVRGIGYVLLDAGETAILPAAIPPAALGDVNGWRSSSQEGMKLVAPLAGAGLYAWHGPVPVVLMCAAMPLLTATCYALLRVPARLPLPAKPAGDPPPQPAGGPPPQPAGGPPPQPAAGPPPQPGEPGSSPIRDTSGAGPLPEGEGIGVGLSPVREGSGVGLSPVRAGSGVGLSPVREGNGPVRSRVRGEIREGLAALFGNRAVRVPVLMASAAIALSGLTNAAVIERIVGGLGLPATYLGYLSTAQGAGSIVGGLLVGRLLARCTPAVTAAIGAALFAAGCLTWCLPWLAAMIAGSVLVGLGLPWTLIAGVTAVQTRTPEHLLGRVAASATTLMFGPVALAIPIGAAAVHLGSRPPLLLAAVLALAVAATQLRRAGRARHPADAGRACYSADAGRACYSADAGCACHPADSGRARHPADADQLRAGPGHGGSPAQRPAVPAPADHHGPGRSPR